MPLTPSAPQCRLRCRDQASVRGQRLLQRLRGKRGCHRPSVCPVPQERRAPGSRRRAGRGGAGLLATPLGSQLHPPPGFCQPPSQPRAQGAVPCRGPLLALGGSGHKTGRGVAGQREGQPGGTPVSAKTQVHSHPWSNAPCPGGIRGTGHFPPRILRGWECCDPWGDIPLTPRPQRLWRLPLKSRGPSNTADLSAFFLGSPAAPTCFKTKYEEGNSPVLPVHHQPPHPHPRSPPLPANPCTDQNEIGIHALFLDLPSHKS